MRLRLPLRALTVIGLVLAVALPAAGWETISWEQAADHDGETVVVEGDVVAARMETIGCVLEFAPDDPKGFRVVIVIPMISDLPRRPDRLYEGKRVRITGRIDVFKRRPEIIVRDPDVIQVVDVATGVAAPISTDTTTTTPPPAALTTTLSPIPAPAVQAAPPPAPDSAPARRRPPRRACPPPPRRPPRRRAAPAAAAAAPIPAPAPTTAAPAAPRR
ncbi:MAG: hypothetical protein KIT14_19605 [bacterium]|nr:hypothetical protein [bacterium]